MSLPQEIQEVLEGKRRWAVVCADNREVLPLMPDKSVGHVITDPPYSRRLYLNFRSNSKARRTARSPTGKGLNSEAYQALASMKIGAVEDVLPTAAPAFLRLARRWIIAFHDAETGHLWREAFGATYIRTGAWVKPNPVPQMSGDRPGTGLELCTIAHQNGRKRWNGGGLPAVWIHLAIQSNWAERVDHPCPKPVSLMLELVELFTDPDELILDPFAGSGTTGVAALRLGRRAILIEKDPKYAALATERMKAEERGQSLREYRAGQLPMFADPPD